MNKQKVIQIITFLCYALGGVAGLSTYLDMIPEKYKGLAVCIIGLSLATKEGLTVFNQYLVGPSALQTPKVQEKLKSL